VAEVLEDRRLLSGTLDTTWGTGGVVSTDFQGSVNAQIHGIARQPDGKYVVAGTSQSAGPTTILVARYTVAGVLDPTFGQNGLDNITAGTFDNGLAVAVQADGKILVAGASSITSTAVLSNPRFTVVRLNADGSLDTSFGSGGDVFVNLGAASGEARAITVTPSGQIVVAGEMIPTTGSTQFAVARLNSDGSPDTTFGGGTGLVLTPFTGYSANAYAVAVDSSGRIVVDGSAHDTAYNVAVARLNNDGSPDTTFGSGGELIDQIASRYDTLGAVAIGPSGQIDLASDTYSNPLVIQLTSSGQLDPSFGTGGTATVTAPTSGLAGIGVLSDGSVVVAGTSGQNPLMEELSPSGGTDYQYLGASHSGAFSPSIANAALVNSDGSAVIAGYLYITTNAPQYYVARLLPGGGPDTTFGTAGQTVTPVNGAVQQGVQTSLLQPDGKLLVGGWADPTYGAASFALTRYNADGSIDGSFGTGGQVLTAFPLGNATMYGLTEQPDGDIVTVGTENGTPAGSNTSQSYMVAARYTANGQLDPTFGTNGEVVVPRIEYGTTASDYGRAVAVLPDGDILLGGGDNSNLAVAEYLPNGTINYSYGNSGIFTLSSQIATIRNIAPLPNGDLILSGNATYPTTSLVLARVLPTGQYDPSFGTEGAVNLQLSSPSLGGMAIQPDGKIVLAGTDNAGTTYQPVYDDVVARFNPDGSLDPTFSSTGVEQITALITNPYLPTAVRILSNGDILFGAGGGKVYLTELLPTGGLDTTFGTGGNVADPATTVALGSNYLGVDVRPNGNLVVAGLGKFGATGGISFFGAQFLAPTSPATGVITGEVFQDYYGTGVQTTDDPGLAGATVYLDLNGDATLDDNDPRAVTGASGDFYFAGLQPGTYTVREILPTGYTRYYAINPGGTLATPTVTTAAPATVSFGLAMYSTITGNIFNDHTGNGFSTGNPALTGWTIYLDLNGNGVLDPGEPSTVSDVNGNYSLSQLPAGTYALREVVQPGWMLTEPLFAYDHGYYTVALGALLPTAKTFGDFQLGTAAGVLFDDVNGNDVQDAAEPGLAGWTVYADVNGTGIFAANDPTAVTNSTGQYVISGLGPGLVNVSAIAPGGWGVETITASQRVYSGSSLAFNVGARPEYGSITGTEYEDGNADGMYGPGDATVAGLGVFIDTNNNGIPDSGEPVATTNLSGTYTFSNLTPGTYVVRQELISSGWYQTEPAGGAARAVVVASGQAVTGQDFGQAIVQTATISGTVFADTNGDGKQETGEPGLAGVTVFVDSNRNGTLDSGELTAVTNASGGFVFTGLTAGTYQLRETVPAGYKVGTPAAGYVSETLVAGQTASGAVFGDVAYTPASAKLTGTTIGTAGSYNNDGNTIAKATDGNLSTFFDGPTANGNWVGLDLGAAPGVITQVEYASRSGFASRMNGGIFQAGNSANFSSGVVTLYTIGASANPSSTALTAQTVTVPGAYRYVRYLSPAGSYGDVSEVQFFGYTAPVVTVAAGQSYHIAAAISSGTVSPYGGINVASGAAAIADSSSIRNLIEVGGTGLSLAGTSGAWTGRIDLGKNDLDLVGGNLATVSNQIHQGYANGSWNGTGGITSSAAASDPRHLTAVGAILNSTTSGGAVFGTLDGTPVAAGDVLVRYTYFGDANLDGKVDGSDYSRIDAGYAADKTSPGSATGWFNGDFNYDGVVDGSDYALIDNAFNNQGAALATASALVAGPSVDSVSAPVEGRPTAEFPRRGPSTDGGVDRQNTAVRGAPRGVQNWYDASTIIAVQQALMIKPEGHLAIDVPELRAGSVTQVIVPVPDEPRATAANEPTTAELHKLRAGLNRAEEQAAKWIEDVRLERLAWRLPGGPDPVAQG
jgi:uncharacterized delta-60 repeat protein